MDFPKARFFSKAVDIAETESLHNGVYSIDPFKIVDHMSLTDEAFHYFKNNLQADYDFLEGKGGTSSTTTNTNHEQPMTHWSPEDFETFRKGYYRKCVAITSSNATNILAVDPQGYNYARYIAVL